MITYNNNGGDKIERTVLHSDELFRLHPHLLPSLGTITQRQMNNYVDRLFIPNVEEGANGEVRLTTPRSLRGQDLLGIIALRGGQTIFLDEELVTPTYTQQEQMKRYLEQYEAFTGDATRAVDKTIDFMRAFMPYGALTNPQNVLARTIGSGVTSAAFKQVLPGLDGDHVHQIVGRPLMFLSDDSAERVSPALFAHEADHAIESMQQGIRPSAGDLPMRHRLRSELRGYHVSDFVARALVEMDYDTTNDGSDMATTSRAIEGIRVTYATDDDPFLPSDDIVQEIDRRGYGAILE